MCRRLVERILATRCAPVQGAAHDATERLDLGPPGRVRSARTRQGLLRERALTRCRLPPRLASIVGVAGAGSADAAHLEKVARVGPLGER